MAGCGEDDNEDETTSSTSATDGGDGDGELGNCTRPLLPDRDGCMSFCLASYENSQGAGCDTEYLAVQACIATTSCDEFIPYRSDPNGGGASGAETGACLACLV